MLKAAIRGANYRLLLCSSCMDARGLAVAELIEGAQRSDMATLSAASCAADKALVF